MVFDCLAMLSDGQYRNSSVTTAESHLLHILLFTLSLMRHPTGHESLVCEVPFSLALGAALYL